MLHFNRDEVFSPEWLLFNPTVVLIRNPYYCFMGWLKRHSDAGKESWYRSEFFRQWEALSRFLAERKETIIFKVDRDSLESLADNVGLAYSEVDARETAHHMSDKYFYPRYENLPSELHYIATQWGYSRD